IGDGGNDAAMIQEANVGVGILSTPDNQAVQCCDYALNQFCSLTSLVLLHGRWNSRRLVLVVLFIFYKNIVMSTIFCMYSFATNFSGQLPFDSHLVVGWNVVYTFFPLLVLGMVDRDITTPIIFTFPRIYFEKDIDLSTKTILLWIAKGAFQAVVSVMLVNGVVETSTFDTGGIFMYGIILSTVSLLIVLTQSTLMMQRWYRWSVWHFGALVGSIIGVIIFIAICEQVYRLFPYASSLYNISGLLFEANWYMVLLLLILVPFSSLLPEFVWYAVEKLYMYNNLHILQEIDSGLGIESIVPMVLTIKKSHDYRSKDNFDCVESIPNQLSDCEVVIQQLKSFRLKTQCLEHEQEHYNLDIQMHPVTMEFIGHLSSNLEREYCIAFFSQESLRVCRTVFIATGFYLINVLIRYFLMDESALYIVSRCGIVFCAFIYAIAARTRLFQKHYDVLLVIFMISAGTLISATIQTEGYITFTLFPIALFAIFRIKFAWALALAAVNFIMFLLIAFSHESSKTGLGFFTGYILFIIIFAASGSWRVQLAMRQDFLQRRSLALEERRALNILQHMLPTHIMNKLQHGDPIISEAEDDVTILFCDVVDFSTLLQQYSPAAVVSLLDHLYSLFDELCAKYGVQKMETVGKTYMACAGLQEKTAQYKVSPALRAACMALEMLNLINACTTKQGPLIKIRIGLHSGRVISGLVGRKKQQFSLFGDTVNTASRMQSTGTPGSCQVSQITQDKLINDFTFSCPNQVFVKGKGDMETYTLGDPLSEQAIQWYTKPGNVSSDKMIRNAEPVANMEQTLNDEMRSELHSLWLQFHDPEMETEYLNATSTAREEATTRCLSALGLYVIFALLRDFSQAAVNSNNGFNFLLLFVIPRLIYLGIIVASLFWVRFGQKYLFQTSCFGILALGALHLDKIFSSLDSSGISEFNLLALDVVWIMFVLSSGGAMLYVRSIAFNLLSCLFMLTTTVAMCLSHTCEYNIIYAIVVVKLIALANGLISRDIEFFTRRKVWLETQTNIQTRTADRLLYQRLPEEVVTRMKQGQLICDEYRLVGILYSDIKGFTSIAARSDPEQVIQMLDSLFAAFDILTEKHGVFKLQTIGDAYVIVSGLPFIDMSLTQESLPIHDNGTSPTRRKSDRMRAHRLAQQHSNFRRTNVHLKKPCLHVHQHMRNLLQMAMDMHDEVAKIRDPMTNEPLQMRIGVHLGNMIGGVIGDTTLRYDMWGLDAMFANTLESNGLPGGVVVSEAVKNVVEEAHDDIKCKFYKTLDSSVPIYTVEFDRSKRENTCPSPRKSNLTSGVASPLRRKLFS
ncbi:phospholipid-transporting ATPase, partial [Thraustotheca clavata]